MKPTDYGYLLEIINNKTKENLSKSCMSNNMQVIIKELENIIKELKFLYPKEQNGLHNKF